MFSLTQINQSINHPALSPSYSSFVMEPPKKKTKANNSASIPSGVQGDNHNGRDDSADDADPDDDENTDDMESPALLPRTRTYIGELVKSAITIQGLHDNPGSGNLILNPEQELDVRQRHVVGTNHVVGLFTTEDTNELAGNVGTPINRSVHTLLNNIQEHITQDLQVIGQFTGEIVNVAQYNWRGVNRGDPIGGILRIRFYTTDADPQGVALHLRDLFPTDGTLRLIIPNQFIDDR